MRSRAINMAGFTLLPVILAMSLIAAIAFLLNRDNGINAAMVASQGDANRARYVAEAGLQAVNALTQGKDCTGYANLPATPFGADSYTATVNPNAGTPVTLTATGVTAGGASASLTRANIAVSGTQTLTLQPDATGGIDAWLDSSTAPKSDNNEGRNPTLYLSGTDKRPLLKFDLSAIPAGSAITVATLSLYQDRTGYVGTAGSAYNVHRITRTWVEGTGYGSKPNDGATWNKYDGVTAWTTPGGQFDPAVAATTPADEIMNRKTWDVSGLVRDWVSGAVPNNGMLLEGAGANFSTGFASSDNGTAANRPKLVVTYVGPCGAPPPPPPPPPGPPPPPVSPMTLPAIKDTWIDETNGKTAANYGGDISFTVTTVPNRGRGLVQFDLSSIQAGTRFTSATLRLFAGGFSPTTPPTSSILTVYPVNAPWTELGATWKTANGSMNSWLCGCFGGYIDFAAAAASATLSSSFTPGGWVEWNVTALAQEWLDGIRLNYGVGVLMDTPSPIVTTPSVAFNSKEATFAPLLVPQLVLTW